MNIKLPIIVKTHWIIKLIALLPIILGVFLMAVLAVTNVSGEFIGGLVIFVLLGVVLWIFASSYIQIDENSVIVKAPYGKYQIKWEEVKRIAHSNRYISIEGENKRLVVSVTFAGKRTNDMLKYFDYQAQERKFPIE